MLTDKSPEIPDQKFREQVIELGNWLRHREADRPWLLDMLFLVTQTGDYPEIRSDHAFFQKSYVPPPRNKKVEMQQQIDNQDNFFQDLPLSRTKTKRVKKSLLKAGGSHQVVAEVRSNITQLLCGAAPPAAVFF